MDFPIFMYFDTKSMESPFCILAVKISIKYGVFLSLKIGFYVSKQCRICISSGFSLFAKVPVNPLLHRLFLDHDIIFYF